jgi:hypothetical protein
MRMPAEGPPSSRKGKIRLMKSSCDDKDEMNPTGTE